jgi:hypothetical protein
MIKLYDKKIWRSGKMKTCKACGVENRDEAKFCRGCGSPLPVKKITPRDTAKEAAVKKFWARALVIAGVAAIAAAVVVNKMSQYTKLEVVKKYTVKYETSDDMVFGAVKPAAFYLEGLSWNMTVQNIKNIYPYAADGKDPDFVSSMTVQQTEYKVPLPHADFMSLGINNNRLYAVKFEFSALDQYQAQALKVPNRDEIMYGRFRGMYNSFTRLYGTPSFEKNDIKKYEIFEALRMVRDGKMETGAPSNVYVTWDLGQTKAELVLFGANDKIHLTVRYLYMPVWKDVGK